jgi:hypothetical protein
MARQVAGHALRDSTEADSPLVRRYDTSPVGLDAIRLAPRPLCQFVLKYKAFMISAVFLLIELFEVLF